MSYNINGLLVFICSRCDIDEEPEDDDEALVMPTYKKTFKKRE